MFLSKRAFLKKAGPDVLGPGISPMGGGASMSGAGANPTHTAGPSIAAPSEGRPWKCRYPGCNRVFTNGGDLRDHLSRDHGVKDLG
jgi:hypothetical protein